MKGVQFMLKIFDFLLIIGFNHLSNKLFYFGPPKHERHDQVVDILVFE